MTPEQAAALRKPFPESAIGKLPKGGAQLDFVGHAAVTDRLLLIDPAWSWEPFATDEHGLPAYQNGALWIRLTVCGVTRIGVGDGPDPKQRIGDAIRNAAMRFGVALDLWSRQELEGVDPNGGDSAARVTTAEQFNEKHRTAVPNMQTSTAPLVEKVAAPPVDSPPEVDVEALRTKVLAALDLDNKQDRLVQLTKLKVEAGKGRVLNEMTTAPSGEPMTVNVFIDRCIGIAQKKAA